MVMRRYRCKSVCNSTCVVIAHAREAKFMGLGDIAAGTNCLEALVELQVLGWWFSWEELSI